VLFLSLLLLDLHSFPTRRSSDLTIVIASGIYAICSYIFLCSFFPSMKIFPLLIGVNPLIAFKIAVLPDPLIPIRQVISPLFALNDIPFNTLFLPNDFTISLTSIIFLHLVTLAEFRLSFN